MSELTEVEKFEELLTGIKMSKANREALLDAFRKVAEREVCAVLPSGARGPVETVEAYGLLLHLDAHGRAAKIEIPWPASQAQVLDVEYYEPAAPAA